MVRKIRRPSTNPLVFGKSPTAAEKIQNVSGKLGLTGMGQMQGSPLNIYDTVSVVTNAGRQTLTFFKNSGSKSSNFTNWQALQFNAGETLAAEYLYISYLVLGGTDLNSDATTIVSSHPIGSAQATSNLVAYGQASMKIANSTIFKDFQLIEGLPWHNPDQEGMAAIDGSTVAVANRSIYGRTAIKLPTIPIIPPNQSIEFTITIPPITAASNSVIMVTLGRQGSIYSAKNTF